MNGKNDVHTTQGVHIVWSCLQPYEYLIALVRAALAVPPLLAAMGYEPTNGGWQLRAGARNFY